MIMSIEKKMEHSKRNSDQLRIWLLERKALNAPDPFTAKRHRDKIQKIMAKWHGGAA